MVAHIEMNSSAVRSLIKKGAITFGGNRKLKIYGRLGCKSGQRMKIENRVFFTDEVEAKNEGYRPCGQCMRSAYKIWKEESTPLI